MTKPFRLYEEEELGKMYEIAALISHELADKQEVKNTVMSTEYLLKLTQGYLAMYNILYKDSLIKNGHKDFNNINMH